MVLHNQSPAYLDRDAPLIVLAGMQFYTDI